MLLPAYDVFRAHAALSNRECCGMIVDERYVPCRNIAQDDDHFAIDPKDWDRCEDAGKIRAVCHSHPDASAKPSPADVTGCRESGVPWFILGNDGLQRLDPAPIPMVGRIFDYGWTDCYSLVRDYFGDLPDFPREPEFWKAGHSPYLENFSDCGFAPVPTNQAQEGDVFLMRIKSWIVPNHAAVYLGSGMILHHLWGRMSCKEQWGPFMNNTAHTLRRVR